MNTATHVVQVFLPCTRLHEALVQIAGRAGRATVGDTTERPIVEFFDRFMRCSFLPTVERTIITEFQQLVAVDDLLVAPLDTAFGPAVTSVWRSCDGVRGTDQVSAAVFKLARMLSASVFLTSRSMPTANAEGPVPTSRT